MTHKATEAAEALIAPLKKQLDKAIAEEDYHLMINVVRELHKIKVTKEALEKTRIGVVVNKLRLKKENAELVELSKQCINGWKTQLAKEKEKKEKEKEKKEKESSNGKDKEGTPKSTVTETAKKETDSPATARNAPVASTSASPKASRANPKPKKSNSISNLTRSSSSGDFDETKYRATMKGKFADALAAEGEEQKEKAKTIGDNIEEALFTSCGGITDDYKSKLRSYLFNLKDAKNSSLRSSLLSGNLEPSDFVTMTAEELANPELKEWRIKTEKQLAINAQSGPPESEQQTTDMFKCGKCGQRKTAYYQLQTRSADEPMTTFITCVNCGNRWKQY